MPNELTIDIGAILVTPGTILFPEYERIKSEAQTLAAAVSELEVSDENIKLSKKLLARVNKRIKEIEDRRIQIKKEMLQPYNEFEQQVKEIVGIVKEADQLVRDQVRELEELDRERKRETIAALFELRIENYHFGHLLGFQDFLKPSHLNKTTTMNAIETEMVQWMEKIENDITVIRNLPKADRIMTEYLDTKDLATAMRIVQEYDDRLRNVRNWEPEEFEPEKVTYSFTLFDSREAALVENFMTINKINFVKAAR